MKCSPDSSNEKLFIRKLSLYRRGLCGAVLTTIHSTITLLLKLETHIFPTHTRFHPSVFDIKFLFHFSVCFLWTPWCVWYLWKILTNRHVFKSLMFSISLFDGGLSQVKTTVNSFHKNTVSKVDFNSKPKRSYENAKQQPISSMQVQTCNLF